ncbi:toxin-antitoxin system YwqK family antitoxin [Fusobacterium canifelinum]|uniref:toxin-antitoxin system YwqK family antitoxin n=1 Tax=Fusobacterium canifelinum TaxID=285729 RepID=UPI0030CE42C5
MKKILLILFLMISVLSFATGRVIRDTEVDKEYDIELKDNIIYEKDGKKVYTGIVEKYSEDGILQERREYKNGKADGISKFFYPDGKLSSETTYKNGKRNGLEKAYQENGKLEYEIKYKDGQPDGNMKFYDENGNLVADAPYVEVTTK